MEAVADLIARGQRDIDEGRVPSCQLAFARDGQLALWVTLGDAEPESRDVIYSSTKPVVAAAMWILMGEGAIDITRPRRRDRSRVRCQRERRHHDRAGDVAHFRIPGAPFNPLDWDDREKRLARFAQWRCNWEPGTRFQYHATSAHWVLAELIERCTGMGFRDFVRTRVIEPLGLPGLQVGVPLDQQGDINTVVATGSRATPDELEAVLGIRELPVTEVTTPR